MIRVGPSSWQQWDTRRAGDLVPRRQAADLPCRPAKSPRIQPFEPGFVDTQNTGTARSSMRPSSRSGTMFKMQDREHLEAEWSKSKLRLVVGGRISVFVTVLAIAGILMTYMLT